MLDWGSGHHFYYWHMVATCRCGWALVHPSWVFASCYWHMVAGVGSLVRLCLLSALPRSSMFIIEIWLQVWGGGGWPVPSSDHNSCPQFPGYAIFYRWDRITGFVGPGPPFLGHRWLSPTQDYRCMLWDPWSTLPGSSLIITDSWLQVWWVGPWSALPGSSPTHVCRCGGCMRPWSSLPGSSPTHVYYHWRMVTGVVGPWSALPGSSLIIPDTWLHEWWHWHIVTGAVGSVDRPFWIIADYNWHMVAGVVGPWCTLPGSSLIITDTWLQVWWALVHPSQVIADYNWHMVAGVVGPWCTLPGSSLIITDTLLQVWWHWYMVTGAVGPWSVLAPCQLSALPNSSLFIIYTWFQVWWGPGPPFMGHHGRSLCQVRKTALQIQVKISIF